MKHKLLILYILSISLSIIGCGNMDTSPANTDSPRLQISVNHAEEAYFSETISQGSGNAPEIGYCCIGLEDVTIIMDGVSMDLGDALRESKTSLAEFSFLAQSDAASGFCTEQWKSKNGLAKFCYSYPDFDLWITHDIYETPDGLQHRIQQVTLAQPGSNVVSVYNDLDYEDWGIEFTVAEASATEITLNYSQSGGQLIGQLMTAGYEISRLNPMEAVPRLDPPSFPEQIPISHNTQGQITLDLESYFGVLPAGEYGIYLYLEDTYVEEDIPLLTRNYHDLQCYWIEFIVP